MDPLNNYLLFSVIVPPFTKYFGSVNADKYSETVEELSINKCLATHDRYAQSFYYLIG